MSCTLLVLLQLSMCPMAMHVSHDSLFPFAQQTLGDEHLLCCSESQTDTDTTLSTSISEVEDESVTPDESCKDLERSCDLEVEERNSDVLDMTKSQDSTLSVADDDAIKCTHISLPLPGCDVTGIDIYSAGVEAAQESRQRGKGKR